MKRIPISWLLFACCLALLSACKKADRTGAVDRPEFDITGIRTAYAQIDHYALRQKLNDSLFIAWRPQWDQAFAAADFKSYKNLVYIPLKGQVVGGAQLFSDNLQTNVRRFLAAQRSGNGYDLKVCEIYSGQDPRSQVRLDRSQNSVMLVQGLDGHCYGNFRYLQGEPQTSSTHTEACLYYHECTWVAICNGVQNVVYTRGEGHPSMVQDCGIPNQMGCGWNTWFQGYGGWQVYCNPDEIDPLPPVYTTENWSGTGGAGGPSNDLTIGGGGNYGLDTVLVDKSVADPCLAWATQVVLNRPVLNQISAMFNQIFGGKGEYTVVFTQEAMGSIDAAKTLAEGNYFIKTRLNSDVLTHSSKELIVATLVHEMLHGIFLIKKKLSNDAPEWKVALNHEMMANNYVTNMADFLQSIFFGLNYNDALALSWEGLEDTDAWTKFKTEHPNDANLMQIRADQFERNHSGGTRCP
ncbi:MAG TPA: hypothetical protein VM802_01080 [Chitinophaga sp.]|uniref:hypothetical protein n=1 Tax=Chitinophaga sp. TaxID=1869181 RepID=UPI002C570266|nr:hypothetical protein [Chitinophaga sp.]HVI43425.1 hypothetical protein [Chitinophaga sp.]